MDLSNFLVAELAKSFGFPFKNRGAESLDDFRYALSPRHWGQGLSALVRIGQKVRKVRISRAFLAQLNGRDSVVDTEVMSDATAKQSEFEQNCLTVLNCYAVRDAAAKSATKEYAGWLDRILDIQGIEKTILTSIHGFLIAQGLIRFEFNGRSVGLQYQISTQGREAMARESVYLSDDPHRNESMADNESISHAA